MMNTGQASEAAGLGSRGSVAPGQGFTEWWDSMLWHRVLRSAVLGLRPGRIGLAFFLVVAAWLVLLLGQAIDAQLVAGPRTLPLAIPGEDDPFAVWRLFVELPLAWVRGWPLTTLIGGPIVIVLGAVLLGAVSRITAEEFSRARFVPWNEGLTYSARLWRSTLGAYLGPVLLIWLLALTFAILGWLFMNLPGLNVIGGLLYGLFLLGSLIAVLVGIAFVLGAPLLAPAVMCEGADAIDAVQRAYAYVLARPLRLVIYLALAAAGVIIVAAILWAIAMWTIGFALQSTGAWTGEAGWEMLWWGSMAVPQGATGAAEQPEASYAVGAAFIRMWVLVPVLLVIAAIVSMAASAATVVYLSMRRVCDGQDLGELWTPGAVEASMVEVMASRAHAAGNQGVAAPTVIEADRSDEV